MNNVKRAAWAAIILAIVIVIAFTLWPDRWLIRPWADGMLDLRKNVNEFQTLIGGIFALAAGALAYFGLRQQIQSGETQHKKLLESEIENRNQLQVHRDQDIAIGRDERVHHQNGRAAAIAMQVRYAGRAVRLVTNDALRCIKLGHEDVNNQPVMFARIRNEHIARVEKAIERFDETFRWLRDALLEIRPKAQRHLVSQIEYAVVAVRNVNIDLEVLARRCAADKFPSKKDGARMQEHIDALDEVNRILKAIIDAGGVTNAAAVKKLVKVQDERNEAVKPSQHAASSLPSQPSDSTPDKLLKS